MLKTATSFEITASMSYANRVPSNFDPGQLASPSYSHASHQRSSPSPATGAEGLPAPFDTHHPYQQHNQLPPHSLPLPHTASQSPGTAYPQMRTATPHLGLSSSPQYSLPSMHNQDPNSQAQRPYTQMAPPQPYSPGQHPGAHYSMPMGSHLRSAWQHSAMAPPMMPPHPGHMHHQPQMMFPPNQGYHPGYYGQPAPHQERPFKCEQCKAAFSRNHDLKRHKRIHLAVKPFPCDYCDKTFTRKDALKRHRLVKGCEAKARAREDGDSPVLDEIPKPGKMEDSDGAQKRTPPATP